MSFSDQSHLGYLEQLLLVRQSRYHPGIKPDCTMCPGREVVLNKTSLKASFKYICCQKENAKFRDNSDCKARIQEAASEKLPEAARKFVLFKASCKVQESGFNFSKVSFGGQIKVCQRLLQINFFAHCTQFTTP